MKVRVGIGIRVGGRAMHGAAIDLPAQARSIAVSGFGASGIARRDARQEIPPFGVQGRAESGVRRTPMLAAAMKEAGGVAVVASNTGRTRPLVATAWLARGS